MAISLPVFAAFTPEWMSVWLTPIWMVGIGALIGLLILLVIWALMFVVASRKAREVPIFLTEGVFFPILVCVILTALTGLAATLAVHEPVKLISAVSRLPYGGTKTVTATLPPSGPEETRHRVAVGYQQDELQAFKIATDQPLVFTDGATGEDSHVTPVTVDPLVGHDFQQRKNALQPFHGPDFYIANLSDTDANVEVTVTTAPAYPQVAVIPIAAVSVIGLVAFYLIQSFFFPKLSAIALSTAKSELAQPLLFILMALGSFLVVLFLFIPYNTFGEDIKMLKDSGLTLIMVLAIIQGIWAASNSVCEEIDGKTALTVLSKPISRLQFLLGKFSGIMWTVALLFIVVGLVFLLVVAYKPVYDAKEMAAEAPGWEITHFEVVRTVPGLVLAFFETAVLVSISVAISTRLPLLANFVICFSIYVLGHLTPLIVQSKIDFAPVVFIGNLIATILPVLDHFNIQAAVAAGVQVPIAYLGTAFLYCVLYSSVALLLALILFEDRDLA